jgi:exosome complex component RRP46
MRGVVLAASIGRLRAPGPAKAVDLVLDPSDDEHARMEGGGCFAFLFGGPSDAQTNSEDDEDEGVPPAKLVWSNYATWTTASGADVIPSSAEEMAGARALAENGATRIWKELKESIPTLDGSRTLPQVVQPIPKKATARPPPPVGAGDFEDEVEEADDDDARMEI